MPRKQRFKPSRKPKPAQPSESTEVRNEIDPSGERTRPYDQGEPVRSPQDSGGAIESAGAP